MLSVFAACFNSALISYRTGSLPLDPLFQISTQLQFVKANAF